MSDQFNRFFDNISQRFQRNNQNQPKDNNSKDNDSSSDDTPVVTTVTTIEGRELELEELDETQETEEPFNQEYTFEINPEFTELNINQLTFVIYERSI